MVGTHRRIRFADLMAHKQQDDARRDEAVAELTRQAQDLDLGTDRRWPPSSSTTPASSTRHRFATC